MQVDHSCACAEPFSSPQIIFTRTWLPLHLMFFKISFPTLLLLHKKGYKVLIEDRPALSEVRCTTLWHPWAIAGPHTGMFYRRALKAKHGLAQNPDVSNRNIKKTKLSLHRLCGLLSKPPGLCDLTKLHGHSAAAERILSPWLAVK